MLLKESEEAQRKMIAGIPHEGWLVEIRGYTYHQGKLKFIEETLIENLRNPGKVKEPGLTKQAQDQIKLVQDQIKVSYLHIYKHPTVDKPLPGQFEVIGKSYLKILIKGDPPPGAPGIGPPPVNAKPSRDPWKAIGETASSVIVDGLPAPLAPDPKAPPSVARTEFVLLFIWQEPLNPTPLPTVIAADKDKKN